MAMAPNSRSGWPHWGLSGWTLGECRPTRDHLGTTRSTALLNRSAWLLATSSAALEARLALLHERAPTFGVVGAVEARRDRSLERIELAAFRILERFTDRELGGADRE